MNDHLETVRQSYYVAGVGAGMVAASWAHWVELFEGMGISGPALTALLGIFMIVGGILHARWTTGYAGGVA